MNEGSGTTDKNLVDGTTAALAGQGTVPVWNTADPSIVFGGGSQGSSLLDAGTGLNFDRLPIGKITLVAKVFVNTLAAAGIAEKNDANVTDSGFVFGWDSTGALQFQMEKSQANMIVSTAAGAVTTGQWMQVAFTWDGTVGTAAAAHIFVNGTEQAKSSSADGSGVLGYVHATARPFRMGTATFGPAGSLNGKMAYVAVYRDRILTTNELNQLDTQLPITTDVITSLGENTGAATATNTTAGQNLQFPFPGWTGQQVTVLLTNNTLGAVTVNLVKPDGSLLATASSSTAAFNLPAATLATAGTYDVVVHPTGATTGSITVGLAVQGGLRPAGSVIDPSNPLSAYLAGLFLMNEGNGTTDKNLVDGATASFTGQGTVPVWNIADPSIVFGGGSQGSSLLDAGADVNFDRLPISRMTLVAKVFVNALAVAGIAEKNDVNVTDSGFVFGWDSSGSLQLQMEKSQANMIVNTAGGAVTTGQWMQVAFTWDGTVGTAAAAHIFVNGTEQAKVSSADGTGLLGYAHATGRPFRMGTATFGPAGSLDGRMAYVAVYRDRILTATELNQLDLQLPITADVTGTVDENGTPSTATTTIPGQGAQFSFEGYLNQRVTVLLSNNTMGAITVNLVGPDGSTLATASTSATAFNLPIATLPATGNYDVVVHPTGSTTGSIAVSLAVQGGLRPLGSAADASNPLAANLVGLFLMNEGSGATDLNVIDNQAASFAGNSLPAWNSADPSLGFNAGASLNSYLNAGTDLGLDGLPTSKITVVSRVYVNAVANAGVAEKNDGDTIDSGFVFGWDSTGALKLTVEKTGVDMSVAGEPEAILPGRWTQVAFTWDGTVGTAAAAHLFVNGAEQAKISSADGSGTLGYANATNKPFRIGNASFGFPGALNGKMEYLAVYKNRILISAELNQLDAQLPIIPRPSTPAVAITDPSNGSTVYLSTLPSLSASSSSTNGASISLVEYFDGSSKLGQASTPPYALTLSSLPSTGSHTYVARVTDSNSMVAWSAPITATLANPKITSVTPDHGQPGQIVTVAGAGFGPTSNGAAFSFNSIPAAIAHWSNTSVDVIVPSGSGAGNMSMAFADGAQADGAPSFGPCSPGQFCVSSFVISPSTVLADGNQTMTGSVTITPPPQYSGGASATVLGIGYQCVAPAVVGETGANHTGCISPSLGFSITVNPAASTTSSSGTAIAFSDCGLGGFCSDQGIRANVYFIGTGDSFGTPDNGPCTDCEAAVGQPINLMTGNTYIQQSDYNLPGLGGGISLTRTWNSQWSSTGPLVVAGMFGDSWRATYEDRLQITSGGVKYWLPDGKVWRFTNISGVYSLTSPVDAHAALAFDSTAQQYTLTFLEGTKEVFGSDGYLNKIVDRNGNTTTLTYDSSSPKRLTQVTDAASRTLSFNYTDSAHPRQATSIQDSVGTVASYVYDSSSRLLNTTYADGSVVNYNYNSNGLITSVTDHDGKVLEAHTYDSQRRGLTSQRANGAELVTISYPSPGITHILDSLGNVSDYHYTAIAEKHFILSMSGPGCSTCGYRGGAQLNRDPVTGNKNAAFDANGNVTLYTYDANGNVTSRSTPGNGHLITWQYTYNNFGELLTSTDPLGNTTTNTYDSNGNLLSTTTPAPDSNTPASVTTFAYDSKGQLTSITDPLNHTTTLAYYPTGLLHTSTDAQNNVTTFEYDPRGNRTAAVDALSNRTTFDYDAVSRLTKVHNPDSSTVSFAYDARGRRTSVTDGNGKVTGYAYDDADRLTSVTDANNNTTQYAYDAEGNLTSITDANNHATSFAYDAQQHLTKTTFPSAKFESYTYDHAGNLMTKTDRKGQTINYFYDNLARLVSKSYPDSTSINYSYDDADRLLQVQDPTGTCSFSLDNMGRLKEAGTSYSFLPGRTFAVAYGYNAASQRTSLTDPSSGLVSYRYDNLNRLTTIADYNSNSFGFGYDALGRRTQLTRPNGVNTNYSYDVVSNLSSVSHQQGSATLDGAAYTYDSAGNRKSKTNRLNSTTSSYAYDNTYQLTGVTGPNPESYGFDPVGNRLSSQSVSSYTYNASNEMAAAGSASYIYDDNGNLLTKSDSAGTTTYNWDFENRLTSTHLPSGNTVNFKYDPFGRRIQKGTSLYVYDGTNLLEEADTVGNLVARYVFGNGIDEPLVVYRGGVSAFYQADGLGTITSLSTTFGVISDSFNYDSFGNLIGSSGSFSQPFRYTAREFDIETGLYYYRARYYDSQVGHFISEDPLGFFGGRNFYSYAWNNPVNLIDPRGTIPGTLIGQLPPVQPPPGSVVVDLNDPEIRSIGHFPWPQATRYYWDKDTGNSHECIALTRHFTKLPCSGCWRAGPKALGNNIAPGTAIATFDANGRYPQEDVPKNSGIYLGTDFQDLASDSFVFLDQWKGHMAQARVLQPERHGPRWSPSNDSRYYSVITVPYGTKSRCGKCGNW